MIQASQEAEARNVEAFPFEPTALDALIVSHAHIDHIGRIPLLVQRHYDGPIYAQTATADSPKPVLDSVGLPFLPKMRGCHPADVPTAQNRHSEGKNVKNSYVIATCLALALPTLTLSTDADAAGKGQRGPRGELVHRIVMKWGNHVQEAYRANVGEWAAGMVPVFAKADLQTLRRAASAPTFESMNDAFLVDDNGNTAHTNLLKAINTGATNVGKVPTKLLGETTNDLVFVPITPCRIIDTRVAGGVIAANTVRSFDVTAVANYSFQGGDATNCGGAGGAGSFAAAAINFTVVTPSAAGYITAFPFLATQPLAATVNYATGDIVGNFAVVRLDQGASANELSVYSFAQTHLVADLVGYYINPVLGELDCVETVSSANSIAANGTGSATTPACAAGYTIVSGGCSMDLSQGQIVTSRLFPGSGTQFCFFRNRDASLSSNGVAYGRCCKLPSGRAP